MVSPLLPITNPTKNKKNFSSVLILGIKKIPSNAIEKTNAKKKKSKIKIFLKIINKNHILPTRYLIDLIKGKYKIHKKMIRKCADYFAKNLIEKKILERNTAFFQNFILDKYIKEKKRWIFQKIRF